LSPISLGSFGDDHLPDPTLQPSFNFHFSAPVLLLLPCKVEKPKVSSPKEIFKVYICSFYRREHKDQERANNPRVWVCIHNEGEQEPRVIVLSVKNRGEEKKETGRECNLRKINPRGSIFAPFCWWRSYRR